MHINGGEVSSNGLAKVSDLAASSLTVGMISIEGCEIVVSWDNRVNDVINLDLTSL